MIECFSFNSSPWYIEVSSDPSLTSGAAETFSLLPPFGVTEDVNDECGKLTSVETGKLLTALREEYRKTTLLDIRDTHTHKKKKNWRAIF